MTGLDGQLPAVLLDSLGGAQEADDGVFPLGALIRRTSGGFRRASTRIARCCPSSVPQAPMATPTRGSTVGLTDAQLIPTMMQGGSRPTLVLAGCQLTLKYGLTRWNRGRNVTFCSLVRNRAPIRIRRYVWFWPWGCASDRDADQGDLCAATRMTRWRQGPNPRIEGVASAHSHAPDAMLTCELGNAANRSLHKPAVGGERYLVDE